MNKDPKELLFTEELKTEFSINENLPTEILLEKIEKELIIKNTALSKKLFSKQINQYGHLVAFHLFTNGVKYSQLRRFVDALKDIDNLAKWELKKQKVEAFPIYLINGYARQKDLKLFSFLFSEIIENNMVQNQQDLDTLLTFIDSITAYFDSLRDKEKENG